MALPSPTPAPAPAPPTQQFVDFKTGSDVIRKNGKNTSLRFQEGFEEAIFDMRKIQKDQLVDLANMGELYLSYYKPGKNINDPRRPAGSQCQQHSRLRKGFNEMRHNFRSLLPGKSTSPEPFDEIKTVTVPSLGTNDFLILTKEKNKFDPVTGDEYENYGLRVVTEQELEGTFSLNVDEVETEKDVSLSEKGNSEVELVYITNSNTWCARVFDYKGEYSDHTFTFSDGNKTIENILKDIIHGTVPLGDLKRQDSFVKNMIKDFPKNKEGNPFELNIFEKAEKELYDKIIKLKNSKAHLYYLARKKTVSFYQNTRCDQTDTPEKKETSTKQKAKESARTAHNAGRNWWHKLRQDQTWKDQQITQLTTKIEENKKAIEEKRRRINDIQNDPTAQRDQAKIQEAQQLYQEIQNLNTENQRLNEDITTFGGQPVDLN